MCLVGKGTTIKVFFNSTKQPQKISTHYLQQSKQSREHSTYNYVIFSFLSVSIILTSWNVKKSMKTSSRNLENYIYKNYLFPHNLFIKNGAC